MAQTPWPEASLRQQKALAWVPKITSLLSLLGSIYILFDILRIKHRNTYHRILVGMNIMDLLSASAWFFTTWPMPQEQLSHNNNIAAQGARGNQATCNAQGYFSQLSISVVLYNACLALYFMVVIRFGWTEAKIKQAKLEWYIHIGCVGVGIFTSSLALGMDLYNPVGWQCWIGAWPIGCAESWKTGDNSHTNTASMNECERGDNANMYLWFLFYLPLWASIIFASGALYQVYAAFHRQKKQGDRWRLRFAVSRAWGLPGHGKNSTQHNPQNNNPQNTAPDEKQNPRMDDGISNTQTRHLRHLNSMVFALKNNWNNKSRQNQSNRQARNKRKKQNAKSQLVTSQALLYVFSFYVAWFFPSVLRIQETISSDGISMYHWVFLSAFFAPLQGLLNFVIYLRPKYLQIRLIKERIAALADKQQQQQEHHQRICQLCQLSEEKSSTVVSTDHSHGNNQDHTNHSEKSRVYGKLTNRPLIDSSKSLDPQKSSAFHDIDDDDMSMELTTMMMMVEKEMLERGDVDFDQDGENDNDGMAVNWNKESIDQLHASFAGNLSFPRLKSTISGATNANSRTSSKDNASNNSSKNTDTIALFNESLNIEQLEDLMEEEGEEEEEDDESDHHDNFNDDLSEYVANDSVPHEGSSDEEEEEDDEDMDPALKSLFDAMTLNSGDTPSDLWKKQQQQGQRRPTLKRSNSSEYNFASMRRVSEEVKINPRLFERFHATMDINGEGHVVERFRRPNRKQELLHKRPHDKRLHTHQSHRIPNRAMAADENPMSQSVPLTIDSSKHKKQHVPLTGSDRVVGQDTNNVQQRPQDTTISEALSVPIDHDSNATDEYNGDFSPGGRNGTPGSPIIGGRGPSKPVGVENHSGSIDNVDTITSSTSSPTSEQDQKELSHKLSNVAKGEKEVKCPQKNTLAEFRIASRNRRLIPRSGTDPERLGRMKMDMFGRKPQTTRAIRRTNTSPNPQPSTRVVRPLVNNASGKAAREPRSRRPARRMSDRSYHFGRDDTAPELTTSQLTRTRTSDGVLHKSKDSGWRGLGRKTNSDKRKQMMIGQAKEWASSQFTSFRSFAQNVKDALKADDLSEWAIVMNELETELSAGPHDGNRESKPVFMRNRKAETEEEKQEILAMSIESPPGNQENAATVSERSPRRERCRDGDSKNIEGSTQGNGKVHSGAVVPPKRVPRAVRMRKDSD